MSAAAVASAVAAGCANVSCCHDGGDDLEKGAAGAMSSFAKQLRLLDDGGEELVSDDPSEWMRFQSLPALPERTPSKEKTQPSDSSPRNKFKAQGQANPRVAEAARSSLDSKGVTSAQRRQQLVMELQRAQREARRRAWLIRGPTLAAGSLLMVSTALMFVIFYMDQNGSVSTSPLALSSCFGSMALLLAVLPTDNKIIEFACWLTLMMIFATGAFLAYLGGASAVAALNIECAFEDVVIPCWATTVEALADFAASLGASSCVIFLLQGRLREKIEEPVMLLSLLHRTLGFVWMVIGACSFVVKHSTLLGAGCPGGLSLHAINVTTGAGLMLAGWTFRHPRCRQVMQLFLGSRVHCAGAGLAELLGGRAIEEVFAVAQSNFRSISCEKVTFAEFESKEQEMSTFAEFAEFGSVDAYISQSWDDDPRLRWDALQAWRRTFKEVHGREPRIWLDSFCSTKLDAEASLALLPLYIAGCRSFLSLGGSRYASSTRCLIEVYTFAEIGRPADAFEIRVLSDIEHGEMQNVVDKLKSRRSTCRSDELPAVRNKMERVLEAGYGSEGLDFLVKKVLTVGLDSLNTNQV